MALAELGAKQVPKYVLILSAAIESVGKDNTCNVQLLTDMLFTVNGLHCKWTCLP